MVEAMAVATCGLVYCCRSCRGTTTTTTTTTTTQASWLNNSGNVAGAWAFDGVRGIARLTRGRVSEADLSQAGRIDFWTGPRDAAETVEGIM